MAGNTVAARAPSNIALVKYMGKTSSQANLPENGSLSMTLRDLCTFVEASFEKGSDGWIPEAPRLDAKNLRIPKMGEKGVEKVRSHVARVRRAAIEVLPSMGVRTRPDVASDAALTLRTANTFPEASGIASSASAYAAITLATMLACADDPAVFERAYDANPAFRGALARISRVGSGSSCRSFDGPWVEWEGEDAAPVAAKLPELAHFVLIVSESEKEVSSSQAHLLVKSSPLWHGRVERTARRKQDLKSALAGGDLRAISAIAWAEAWEMHSLFHTAEPPFSYWQAGSIAALQWLRPQVMGAAETPPIVTMDAGPNVHITVEASRAEDWRKRIEARFPGMLILQDSPGTGARPIPVRG